MEGSHLLASFHGLLSFFLLGSGGGVKESLCEGLHHAQLQLSIPCPGVAPHTVPWVLPHQSLGMPYRRALMPA